MKAYDGMYIDGAWRPAAGPDVIEVVNPADEQVIATVPAGTVEDVDAAVRAARAALPGGPPPRRPSARPGWPRCGTCSWPGGPRSPRR
ncbi:hypothetical protein SHKM778_65810 [Streptomyces sp. KM77-8]|uniref:Aldehyde dehydrogenase domain-containing protein n=1 Tax=Streptomyces haneummycinicus TaxID=3074435 RepID=A0AAT9HRL6_9ACTN